MSFIAGETPKGEYAKELEKAVEEVRKSNKWRIEYMTLHMRDKEHEKLGKYMDRVAFLRKCGDYVDKEILMSGFGINSVILDKIFLLIRENPDWDDEKIAETIIFEEEC